MERRWYEWISWLAQSVIFLSAGTAAFMCGGAEQGSMGVFLCGVGSAMVLLMPRRATPWLWWILAGGLLACASLALLPQGWFPKTAWRQTLEACTAIPLGTSVSVVPRETVFWLELLAASLLTGLFSLGHPVRSHPQLVFALLGTAACAVYAGLSMYAVQTGWKPPFDGGATFGFFPNRNHTATLLVMGCLLGLGVVMAGMQNRHYLAAAGAAVALAICAWAIIFYSPSRAGVVFLSVGVLIWVMGLGQFRNSRPFIVSLCGIGALALFFFLSEGGARERLLSVTKMASSEHRETDLSMDQRVLIYRDSLRMVIDFPFTGTGLGTYRYLYPQYARDSLINSRSIHPEGDWLMLAIEAGPLALIVAMAAIGCVLGQLKGFQNHPYWPLRWGIVCGALVAVLHGLVDVPLHRAQLGWWVLAVGCLGLGRMPEVGEGRRLASLRVQQVFFIVGGVGLLWLGWSLLAAEWQGGTQGAPFEAKLAQKQVLELYEKKDMDGAERRAREAIVQSPMSGTLYYQLGVLRLHFEDTDAEVDSNFLAERLLDSVWPRVPFNQGIAWQPVDLKRSASLWWDAVAREARVEKATHDEPADGLRIYSEVLGRINASPDGFRAVEPPSDASPRLRLAWLEAVPPGVDPWLTAASDDRFLKSLDESQKRRFLSFWFGRGNRELLWRFLESHSEWSEVGWPVRLHGYVAEGNYRKAIDEVCQRYGISLELPKGGSEKSSQGDLPDDPAQAFRFLWVRGNSVGARSILDEAIKSGKGDLAEVRRLRAAVALEKGDLPTTWMELGEYLRAKGSGFSE